MAALIWDNFEESTNIEQGTAIKAAENQSRKITHDELKAIDQPLLEPANIKAERHRGNNGKEEMRQRQAGRRKYTAKQEMTVAECIDSQQ